MSSIESVSSAQSKAASQYQLYLERLRQAKATADAPQDTAKAAEIEKANTQIDSDHDGD